MKILILVLFSVCLGCSSETRQFEPRSDEPFMAPVALSEFPTVGGRLPKADRAIVFSVHRGGDFCATSFLFEGITYSLDVTCSDNIVRFVGTSDDAFVTPEGVRVGDTVRRCLELGGQIPDEDDRSILLPSGWLAVPRSTDLSEFDQNSIGRFEQRSGETVD